MITHLYSWMFNPKFTQSATVDYLKKGNLADNTYEIPTSSFLPTFSIQTWNGAEATATQVIDLSDWLIYWQQSSYDLETSGLQT